MDAFIRYIFIADFLIFIAASVLYIRVVFNAGYEDRKNSKFRFLVNEPAWFTWFKKEYTKEEYSSLKRIRFLYKVWLVLGLFWFFLNIIYGFLSSF